MRKRSPALLSAFVVIACAFTSLSTTAQNAQPLQQSPIFTQAVNAYMVGDYNGCVSFLTQVLTSDPNNEVAHYYMALAQHSLGRMQPAGYEYQWITQHSRDPELLRRAQIGLGVVGAYQQPSQLGAPPVTNRATGEYQPQAPAGATGWLSQNGVRQAQNAVGARTPISYGVAGPGPQGKPRIIDVYTSWCGWCKFFEPIFLQLQSKYDSQIYFQRINAEVGDNKAIVKKYKITGYPTILFLDSSGKLVDRINGAPQTPQDFEQRILKAFPSLKPS